MVVPLRNDEEIISNNAFEALLGAMARPGDIKKLPFAGFESVVTTLVDRECTAYTTDALLGQHIQKSGARLVEIGDADFVFCSASEISTLMLQLKTGSDLYPDDGATLVVLGGQKTGTLVTLTGPGIATSVQVDAFEIPKAAWARRADCIRYPMGFDMVIVSNDQVLAIPRSTQVEIS